MADQATTDRSAVHNGIWMDHFASTTVSGHNADDPVAALSVCHDPELGLGRGLGDCQLYAPTAFLLHRPRAYVEAQRWCYEGCSGPKGSCESSCISGVGMQTFKENLDDMRLVGQVCAKAKSMDLADSCVLGAKSYYSFATGGAVPSAYCQQIEDMRLRSVCLR